MTEADRLLPLFDLAQRLMWPLPLPNDLPCAHLYCIVHAGFALAPYRYAFSKAVLRAYDDHLPSLPSEEDFIIAALKNPPKETNLPTATLAQLQSLKPPKKNAPPEKHKHYLRTLKKIYRCIVASGIDFSAYFLLYHHAKINEQSIDDYLFDHAAELEQDPALSTFVQEYERKQTPHRNAILRNLDSDLANELETHASKFDQSLSLYVRNNKHHLLRVLKFRDYIVKYEKYRKESDEKIDFFLAPRRIHHPNHPLHLNLEQEAKLHAELPRLLELLKEKIASCSAPLDIEREIYRLFNPLLLTSESPENTSLLTHMQTLCPMDPNQATRPLHSLLAALTQAKKRRLQESLRQNHNTLISLPFGLELFLDILGSPMNDTQGCLASHFETPQHLNTFISSLYFRPDNTFYAVGSSLLRHLTQKGLVTQAGGNLQEEEIKQFQKDNDERSGQVINGKPSYKFLSKAELPNFLQFSFTQAGIVGFGKMILHAYLTSINLLTEQGKAAVQCSELSYQANAEEFPCEEIFIDRTILENTTVILSRHVIYDPRNRGKELSVEVSCFPSPEPFDRLCILQIYQDILYAARHEENLRELLPKELSEDLTLHRYADAIKPYASLPGWFENYRAKFSNYEIPRKILFCVLFYDASFFNHMSHSSVLAFLTPEEKNILSSYYHQSLDHIRPSVEFPHQKTQVLAPPEAAESSTSSSTFSMDSPSKSEESITPTERVLFPEDPICLQNSWEVLLNFLKPDNHNQPLPKVFSSFRQDRRAFEMICCIRHGTSPEDAAEIAAERVNELTEQSSLLEYMAIYSALDTKNHNLLLANKPFMQNLIEHFNRLEDEPDIDAFLNYKTELPEKNIQWILGLSQYIRGGKFTPFIEKLMQKLKGYLISSKIHLHDISALLLANSDRDFQLKLSKITVKPHPMRPESAHVLPLLLKQIIALKDTPFEQSLLASTILEDLLFSAPFDEIQTLCDPYPLLRKMISWYAPYFARIQYYQSQLPETSFDVFCQILHYTGPEFSDPRYNEVKRNLLTRLDFHTIQALIAEHGNMVSYILLSCQATLPRKLTMLAPFTYLFQHKGLGIFHNTLDKLSFLTLSDELLDHILGTLGKYLFRDIQNTVIILRTMLTHLPSVLTISQQCHVIARMLENASYDASPQQRSEYCMAVFKALGGELFNYFEAHQVAFLERLTTNLISTLPSMPTPIMPFSLQHPSVTFPPPQGIDAPRLSVSPPRTPTH